jgi:hypothetical protein
MHVIETLLHIEYGFTASDGFESGCIKPFPIQDGTMYRACDMLMILCLRHQYIFRLPRDFTHLQLAVTRVS